MHAHTTGLHCMDACVESRSVETKCRDEISINSQGSFVAERPSSSSLLESIKICGLHKDLVQGSKVHSSCVKDGVLQQNVFVGTALLGMYSKCGALTKAQIVFDELRSPDAASWNVLISGYVEHGLAREALRCFDCMQKQDITPTAITFIWLMKACSIIGDIEKGEQIHIEARRQGFLESNIVICTAVVDMYAKCGSLAKAQEVFDELSSHDVVSWNVLIAGYAQHGLNDEVLRCFQHMRDEGLSPNVVTYVCVLKVCGNTRAAALGKELHDEISELEILQSNLMLGTALVDMYAKCGELTKAQKVFDDISGRDVPLWNALISGYANHGQSEEALDCYEQMRKEGLLPNAVTFVSVLNACSNLAAMEKGEKVHAEIHRQGCLGNDIVLGTALVDMYAKCGDMRKARMVFDELPVQDVACWTALIAGYAQQQLGEDALNCFNLMCEKGIFPNTVTFACIINVCSSLKAIEKGKEIHAEVDRQGLLEKSIVLGSALVDMYAKCGLLEKAQAVLDNMPMRDVASWTSLMAGYAQHGLNDEALVCYERMRVEGILPDVRNFLSIVRTCGSLGVIGKGTLIHIEMGKRGFLDKHTVLGIALVDMYAKCGAHRQAQDVFNNLPIRDTVAWTALIAGYAQLGKASCVFDLFDKMRGYCIEPNEVTFIVLLNACSHGGLVEEGQKYFQVMSNFQNVKPSIDHYTCMVDLFCRTGLFETAVSLIEKVPSSNCQLPYLSLLSACGRYANTKLGGLAFDCAVQVDEKDVAAYVFADSLYAITGMQEEADNIVPLE